ncbi:helix-turn-helix domain-containing protein [Bacillus cereus]|nr:helix-turn-helix domain-containing protein [Bacillus cereus]
MNANYLIREKKFEIKIQSEIKHKISILKLISSEKRWYTFEELAKLIRVSNKTISKCLHNIKDFIPKGWEIQIKKGYGIKLVMPINTSVTEVTCEFFRESLTFQILIILLNNKTTTIFEIVDKLYIQPYMVTRALKKIEKDIAAFGLRIQRKPLKIIGEEWKILNMFTELYSKAYLSSDWPFEFNQKRVLFVIRKLEKYAGVLLSLSSRRKFSYFIAILLIRKQEGHTIHLTSNFLNLNIDTPLYEKLSTLLEEVKASDNIAFSTSEKNLLTAVFKCLNYTFKCPLMEKDKDLKIFHEERVPFYNLIRDFISILDNKLGTQFIKDDDFIYSLIMYFRQKIYLLRAYPHINISDVTHFEPIKEKHLKTFLQVKDVYIKWIQKHKINDCVPNNEILNIVVQVEASRVSANINPKKVIIITKDGYHWERYITSILKEHFGNKIKFISINQADIIGEYDIKKNHNIDFIISTLPVRVNQNLVIQIHPTITKRDLANIDNYINQ